MAHTNEAAVNEIMSTVKRAGVIIEADTTDAFLLINVIPLSLTEPDNLFCIEVMGTAIWKCNHSLWWLI